MKLMRIKRRGKTMLIFLPQTERERKLLVEATSAPAFTMNAESGVSEDGDAPMGPGECMVVDYSPAAEPKKEPPPSAPEAIFLKETT